MESYIAQNASAKAQMDFQERMSNTAHQREVADLKAAGLNPVLSAHGQGAATPNGAEGYIGDALAQSLDALSLSVTQNAKTMNSAVSALGRAAAGGAGRSASSIPESDNWFQEWIENLSPSGSVQVGRRRVSNSLIKLAYGIWYNMFRPIPIEDTLSSLPSDQHVHLELEPILSTNEQQRLSNTPSNVWNNSDIDDYGMRHPLEHLFSLFGVRNNAWSARQHNNYVFSHFGQPKKIHSSSQRKTQ